MREALSNRSRDGRLAGSACRGACMVGQKLGAFACAADVEWHADRADDGLLVPASCADKGLLVHLDLGGECIAAPFASLRERATAAFAAAANCCLL